MKICVHLWLRKVVGDVNTNGAPYTVHDVTATLAPTNMIYVRGTLSAAERIGICGQPHDPVGVHWEDGGMEDAWIFANVEPDEDDKEEILPNPGPVANTPDPECCPCPRGVLPHTPHEAKLTHMTDPNLRLDGL